MDNCRNFQCIIFLFLSVYFVNSQEFITELIDGQFTGQYEIQSTQLNFKVSEIKSYSYLSIKVEGNGVETTTNHIISYYQDQNLNERKQLSQSLNDKTIMWLTKQQIDKEFYLTVECANIPCNFNLTLKGKEEKEAELYVDEQYTYYVTEQNKEMNFTLLCNTDNLEEYNTYIVVWVRGNYKIDITLFGGERESQADNRYYRIKVEEFKKSKYYLKLVAMEGDLINIGALLYPEYADNTAGPKKILEHGEEITGYIKGGLKNYFKINKSERALGYYYDFNNKMKKDDFSIYENQYFLTSHDDEANFFSFQHIKTTEYDGQGNNKYSPLLDGIYYLKKIEEGTTIGLIPMKPDNNFNYLTYEVFPFNGNIKAFIYECNNYPLCRIDSEAIAKSQIEGFQTFYKKFTKDELKNISPISKQQKMLLISCVKSLNEERTCTSTINMKTDSKYVNNTDFFKEFPSSRKFLSKNDKDKYFLKGNNKEKLLYIELFSGSVEINIEPKMELLEMAKKSGYQLYSIPENKDINITVTAKENSIYMINDNYNIKNNNNLYIGSNILLNLGKEEIVEFKVNDLYPIISQVFNYVGFHYFNCPIKIEKTGEIKELKTKNEFFQFFQNSPLNVNFSISNKGNSNDNCLFYINTYQYNSENPYTDGIPLKNDTAQLFEYDNYGNYSLLLSFPHIKFEDNIYINFTLFEAENYTVELFLNDYKNTYYINNNITNITLSSQETKNNCTNVNSICKLLLEVRVDKKEKKHPSKFKIYILSNNTYNPQLEEEEKDKKDKSNINTKVLIIICVVGTTLLIIIIVAVVCLIKSFKKNKDLAKAVDKISFQDDKKDDDEDGGETLLD